jgi:hypothetical protein
MSTLPQQINNEIDRSLELAQQLQQLLQNQAQELQLRKEQLELQKQQVANTHEYTKLALSEQSADRKDTREHGRILQKYRYWTIITLSVLIAVFVTIAICLNKDQIALEVIKYVATVALSGAGGYAIGLQQGKKQSGPDNNARRNTPPAERGV